MDLSHEGIIVLAFLPSHVDHSVGRRRRPVEKDRKRAVNRDPRGRFLFGSEDHEEKWEKRRQTGDRWQH